jgi:hypothetical protein
VAPILLQERKTAEHEEKQYSPAATNNNRQQHGKSGPSCINFMGARYPNAIRHQAPD